MSLSRGEVFLRGATQAYVVGGVLLLGQLRSSGRRESEGLLKRFNLLKCFSLHIFGEGPAFCLCG